jgi:hypothetical protein
VCLFEEFLEKDLVLFFDIGKYELYEMFLYYTKIVCGGYIFFRIFLVLKKNNDLGKMTFMGLLGSVKIYVTTIPGLVKDVSDLFSVGERTWDSD